MPKPLRLRGEDRAEYFHVLCAECGQHVRINLRADVGGPMMEANCQKCGGKTEQKLLAGQWSGSVTRS
jgi:RNase P subunit RPR2